MDAGCVCVASAVGGIPEILDGGRGGVLVAPGDAVGLAEALKRVLTDAPLARALSDRARRAIVERYSIKAITWSYVELYHRLATTAGGHRAERVASTRRRRT